MHDLYYCAIVTFYVCVCYCLCLMYCIILMLCVITCMKYVYACVVGIQSPESLCYLLMYINPTLNKDYLLTLKKISNKPTKNQNVRNFRVLVDWRHVLDTNLCISLSLMDVCTPDRMNI